VKKVLIAAAVASVLAMPMIASASDYDRGIMAVKAHQHQSTCIHQMTLNTSDPTDVKTLGGGAGLAGTLSAAGADSGVILAVCDSCHAGAGVNDPSRRSSIGAGSSNKVTDGRSDLKATAAAFEVGWRSFPHSA
jgi:hypothetical protein